MSAQVITVTNMKGGVGKTTVSYALCAGAVAKGLRVVCMDLDQNMALTSALDRRRVFPASMLQVLQGTTSMHEAMVDAPMGQVNGGSLLKFVAADRGLKERPVRYHDLKRAIDEVKDECDVIIIDTNPHELSIEGPIMVADHIVLPTSLTIVDIRVTAYTVLFIESLGKLAALRGLAINNAKRPLPQGALNILNGLEMNELSFKNVLYYTYEWAKVASGRGQIPEPNQLNLAQGLLEEVLERKTPEENWRSFVKMGRRPEMQSAK